MIPLHRIRLGRPWESRPEGDRIGWTRRFGRPERLSSNEELWLVLEGSALPDDVRLNGQTLAPGVAMIAGRGWNVTGRLQPRNELSFSLPRQPTAAQSNGPPLDVCLEVRLRPVG